MIVDYLVGLMLSQGFINGEEGGRRIDLRDSTKRKTQLAITGFEDEKELHQEPRAASRSWKRQNMNIFLEPLERNAALPVGF